MTTTSGCTRFVPLSADDFRARLPEALRLYVAAMGYPATTIEQRAPMWLAHVLREGWRCIAALDADGTLVGFTYGYRGSKGQWWHEQVSQGLTHTTGGADSAEQWLADYFELTEIHVRPQNQAEGIGEDLLRRLVSGVTNRHVLLSTPEGTSRAWRLYRRMGFVDVLRDYRFVGDHRPFAVLGRTLPLD